jgi:hypothetical protein
LLKPFFNWYFRRIGKLIFSVSMMSAGRWLVQLSEDHDLVVNIETTLGTWEKVTFPKTAKIQEAIQAVIQHFGFAASGNYELRLARDPDTPLKPERPLVSYGIKDGDTLIFTDLGVAVWL